MQAEPAASGPFTAESLLALFDGTIVPRSRARSKIPGPKDLSTLALQLNLMRAEIDAENMLSRLKPLARTAVDDCFSLRDKLDEIERVAGPQASTAVDDLPDFPKMLTATIEHLVEIAFALERVRPPVDGGPRSAWRANLLGLLQIFRQAMRENNRTDNGTIKGCGTAIDAPLTRFICAVVPDLTGETVKAGQVAQAVSELRSTVRPLAGAADKY